MLYITTSKIKESTVGSSFTVTYSANPESVEELKTLHSTYSSVNMSEFTIKPNSSEIPNNCEDVYPCDTCKHNKLEWYSEVCDGCSKAHSNYEPKTEPQTDFVDELIYYIFNVQDADDDNLSAELICRKLVKHGLIDKVDGHYQPKTEPQTERSE